MQILNAHQNNQKPIVQVINHVVKLEVDMDVVHIHMVYVVEMVHVYQVEEDVEKSNNQFSINFELIICILVKINSKIILHYIRF